MSDVARLIAVADLLVDVGPNLDRADLAREAAERAAGLTRAGCALVEFAAQSGPIRGSYPGTFVSLDGQPTLEAPLRTDRTAGTVRVAEPVDGTFTQLDAWLVEVLARRLESQVAAIELHESELASREALRDAELAGELQRALVTTDRLAVGGLEVVGRLVPARQVGGDVFDLVEVGRGALAVLADVSGKGASASLLTSAVLSTVHHHASQIGLRPGPMLRAVADSMAPMLERTGRIVTLAIAAFEPSGREVRIASAGHHPVFVAGPASVVAVRATAPPLGVVPPSVEEHVYPVVDGTALLLASDGLTDQRDAADRPLGMDGLATAFARRIGDDPGSIADQLLAQVHRHAAGVPQDDDQAVVVMTSKGLGR
jgi:serine phosphatase RsbU (regulator of sigma subunit)